MTTPTTALLRAHIVRRAFDAPHDTLGAALDALAFVQADPIRAPARAQDLILRHRVRGYRADDLERRYPRLDVDEDVVYAYGFVAARARALLHPRVDAADTREPHGLAAEVLDFVRRAGPTHPRTLLGTFGAASERNAWGGQSLATTRALEALHYRGHLRVVRREAGVRVYEAAPPWPHAPLPLGERSAALVQLLLDLFGPLSEGGVRGLLRLARHLLPAAERAAVVGRMVREGALVRAVVDGVPYVWPADDAPNGPPHGAPARRVVRFLAPFDPVVWDRARVEHLWGWAYRFEAYTPPARRLYGYYALPLLWGDRVLGWANVARGPDGSAGDAPNAGVDVQLGYLAGRPPRDRTFHRALEAEVARVTRFLGAGR